MFNGRQWTTQDYQNEKLFDVAQQVDDQIKKFEVIYSQTYALSIKKMRKWTENKTEINLQDVVFVLDKFDPITKIPILGIITKILSPRSFEIQYIKKQMIINPTTFEMEKRAKKSTILRPAQSLSLICSLKNCQNVDVELQDIQQLTTSEDDQDVTVHQEVDNLGMNESTVLPADQSEALEPPIIPADQSEADKPTILPADQSEAENPAHHDPNRGTNGSPIDEVLNPDFREKVSDDVYVPSSQGYGDLGEEDNTETPCTNDNTGLSFDDQSQTRKLKLTFPQEIEPILDIKKKTRKTKK